ncbi:MAG: NAD-dependent epimerase/dehydratase family protein [Bacteroidales bacterium]|nr:NAD-dependent epimerase/dehydratase family protein [Bacteroidales bacterium]
MADFDKKHKKILITGGAGFIGSKLALKLIEKGYIITVLDNLSTQIHGENCYKSALYLSIKDKVHFIKGCILNKEDWRKALQNQDVVIHLAAETGTGQSMYEIEKYTDVNIKGTAIFMDILANETHSIKKIILASSRAVYGEGKYHCPKDSIVYPLAREEKNMIKGDFNVKCPLCGTNVEVMATDEESKIHPTSIYGISKYVQEQMFQTIGKSLNIPFVIFRYQNVYGAGQSLSNPYTGILSIFSTRIKNGNDILVFEDGNESRDFIYIDDVIRATILGLEKEEANNEIFNVGSGIRTNLITVADSLKKAYKSNINIVLSELFRKGDIRDNFSDSSKIKSRLGFESEIDFASGIEKFANWVNSQEIREDLFETSIMEIKEKGLYK